MTEQKYMQMVETENRSLVRSGSYTNNMLNRLLAANTENLNIVFKVKL